MTMRNALLLMVAVAICFAMAFGCGKSKGPSGEGSQKVPEKSGSEVKESGEPVRVITQGQKLKEDIEELERRQMDHLDNLYEEGYRRDREGSQ